MLTTTLLLLLYRLSVKKTQTKQKQNKTEHVDKSREKYSNIIWQLNGISELSFPKIIDAWHVCCGGLKNIRPVSSRDYSVDWHNIKYYEQQQGYYYGIDCSTFNVSSKFMRK